MDIYTSKIDLFFREESTRDFFEKMDFEVNVSRGVVSEPFFVQLSDDSDIEAVIDKLSEMREDNELTPELDKLDSFLYDHYL